MCVAGWWLRGKQRPQSQDSCQGYGLQVPTLSPSGQDSKGLGMQFVGRYASFSSKDDIRAEVVTQAGIPRLHTWKEAAITSDSLADSRASVGLWQGGGGDQMGGVTPSLARREPSGRSFLGVSLDTGPGGTRSVWLPRIFITRGSHHQGEGNGPQSPSHPTGQAHEHLRWSDPS